VRQAHNTIRRPTPSLRAKLVLLAFALVIVPGSLFGVMASRDASRALEATVGHQLHMVAEDVARDVEDDLTEQLGKIRGWARQEVMREIIVGDVDKRIATLLQSLRASDPAYLDLFVVDGNGRTVASSDPHLIGVSPPPAGRWRDAIASRDAVLGGPVAASHDGGSVLELAAPVADPENADTMLGVLLAAYDWRRIVAIADDTSRGLAASGLAIDLLLVDDGGRVIGAATSSGRAPALGIDLRADGWRALANGTDADREGYEPRADAFVGRVALGAPAPRWTVLALQDRAEALAPVRRMRHRLLAVLALVLTAVVAAATIVARRMTQPLRSLTDAARELARGAALPPLPVGTRDEIGELTVAFNAMTTDLRRAQQDLVAAAKLASVGEIAAGLAHEIRTPLGIMRGSAQMLGRTAGADPHRTRELVDMIVGEVDRLERVVAALTELGRPHEPSIEETLLAPVLTRAIEFVAGQAASQQVAIARRFERPCLALCDPEQLYHVALNLLVNALHVLPGGGTITVSTFGPEDGRVGFTVADDGPGILPELQHEIFTPFFTRREGGTGLGLAFVERVVVAHAGRVSVQSTPGAGATFRVELPAAEGTA
jgi:signal transduction histidine kinase